MKRKYRELDQFPQVMKIYTALNNTLYINTASRVDAKIICIVPADIQRSAKEKALRSRTKTKNL